MKVIRRFDAEYIVTLHGVTATDNVITTTAQTIIEGLGDKLDTLIKVGQLDGFSITVYRKSTDPYTREHNPDDVKREA